MQDVEVLLRQMTLGSYLSARLAVAYITGLQREGVGASSQDIRASSTFILTVTARWHS